MRQSNNQQATPVTCGKVPCVARGFHERRTPLGGGEECDNLAAQLLQ